MSHTPGPWTVSKTFGHDNGFRIFANGQYIGYFGDTDYETPGEINATLASAAPDLLAALEKSVEVHLKYEGPSWNQSEEAKNWMDTAKRAIAKAKL